MWCVCVCFFPVGMIGMIGTMKWSIEESSALNKQSATNRANQSWSNCPAVVNLSWQKAAGCPARRTNSAGGKKRKQTFWDSASAVGRVWPFFFFVVWLVSGILTKSLVFVEGDSDLGEVCYLVLDFLTNPVSHIFACFTPSFGDSFPKLTSILETSWNHHRKSTVWQDTFNPENVFGFPIYPNGLGISSTRFFMINGRNAPPTPSRSTVRSTKFPAKLYPRSLTQRP